ncbi:MAG: NUDIX domain-containing protein [Nanoarchaeota archaeon]|nr:NUDIX domain-containing protein [Nanoarchaeota archaeon]
MGNGKFYVRIVGIIFDPKERKILIGKNKGDKKYSFVDGELHYDEELNLGIKRVTKEKTGYIISNLGTIFSGIKKKEELAIYFLCEIKDGKAKPGKNVKEIKWVKAKEIENLINEKLPNRLKEYLVNIAD